MTELERLQLWYESHCDGTWEHDHGLVIDTLDNPGWHVRIDLAGTALHNRPFVPVDRGTDDHDWIRCTVDAATFSGFGGPKNLTGILAIFLDWADTPG